MKKLYGSFAAKLIAVILLCTMVLVFFGALAGAVVTYQWEGYTDDYRNMETAVYGNIGNNMLAQLGSAYMEGDAALQGTLNGLGSDSFWIEITDREGTVRFSNYEGGKTLWNGQMHFAPNYSVAMQEDEFSDFYSDNGDEATVTPTPGPTAAPGDAAPSPVTEWVLNDYRNHEKHRFSSHEEAMQWVEDNTVTIKGYLPDPLPGGLSQARQLHWLNFLYNWRYVFLWAAGLSFLGGVLLFVFLLCAAGHRKNTEAIVPSFVENIPFDLFTVLTAGLIAVCLTPTTGGWDWPEFAIVVVPCILAAGLLFLLWTMSFAVRVKLGTLWSSCLLVRLARLAWKSLSVLPLLWKWVVAVAVLALIDLIFRMNSVYSEGRTAFWWFLSWLFLAGATFYAAYSFRKLRKGAKEIANGNLSYTVDDKALLWDLKDHAHDLNHIRDGMNDAVEERLKSERFRTELITNVSHDIKTPLTSIVNYVDLLAKEQPESETQQEYIEVLQRQSSKLKKLIEDLIEASKASTGSLPVSLERCELGVLLDQTAGEYSEKLENAGLKLVLQKPEQPVTVLADGRHLWRVFDNLLNNIVKYAQPGTRVYLNLKSENGKARVTFRNISREALNLNAQELSERFVRGDSSRSTEGSGLGLSIAMSLTKLQKGTMDIAVDGDLFKVTLEFDTV